MSDHKIEEIVILLAHLYSNKDISERTGISVRSINPAVRRIKQRLVTHVEREWGVNETDWKRFYECCTGECPVSELIFDLPDLENDTPIYEQFVALYDELGEGEKPPSRICPHCGQLWVSQIAIRNIYRRLSKEKKGIRLDMFRENFAFVLYYVYCVTLPAEHRHWVVADNILQILEQDPL